MDKLEDGIRYLVRDNNGQAVYVGKWLGNKTVALYIEADANATPLAWFRDERSAVVFINAIGEVR